MEEKETFICMQKKFHCILESLSVMKTLREGCLKGAEGIRLSTGPSLNGGALKDPNTEVTGEERDGLAEEQEEGGGRQIWNITNLSLLMEEKTSAEERGFSHDTAEKYLFDPENNRWEGWMYVGEIPESLEEFKEAEEEFVKISLESLDRDLSDDGSGLQVEAQQTKSLDMLCEGAPCRPSDYLELLAEGKTQRFRFLEREPQVDLECAKKQVDQMVARIGDEEDCRVQQFLVGGAVISRIFCQIADHDKSMIQAFDGVLEEISRKVLSVLPISEMALIPDGAEFILEHLAAGSEESEIMTVAFNAEELQQVSGSFELPYTSVDQCWLCYHLVKQEIDMKAENECCFKFAVNGLEHIVCSNEPTETCVGPMKQMLRKVYSKCVQLNESEAEEPLTCGTDEDYQQEYELFEETSDANSPEAAEEQAEELLEELLDETP